MTDSFSALHPALTFCYFAAVLLLTMFVLHPVFLALSLLGALGYCALLRGWRSLWRTLGRLVPFLVLMAALNALFNHAGVTMLFYLPNGNPVTREALCYGAAAAAMFAAVAAGIHGSVAEAQQAMRPGFSDEYRPDMERHAIYDYLYARYLELGAAR